jgi:PAS domain S-box-containing protein
MVFTVCRDITAKKHFQIQLEEWKDRYEIASTLAGNIVYDWNVENDEVVWGGHFSSILGYRAEEMPTNTAQWLSFVHPEDRVPVAAEIERLRRGQRQVHVEYRVRHANGSYRWLRDDAAFVKDQRQPHRRMIGILTDVTERRIQSDVSQKIVEQSPVAKLVVNAQQHIVSANPAACSTFGYTCAGLLGEEVETLLPRKHWTNEPAPFGSIGNLQASTSSEHFSVVGIASDGRRVPAQLNITPIELMSGPAQLYTLVDQSERDAALHSLKSYERLLHQIIDNSAAVIYVKDLEGRYKLVNQRFLDIFGWRRSEVIGHTDLEIYPAEIAKSICENDRRVLKLEATLQFEETVEQLSGPRDYVSVKFLIRDLEGRPSALAGISTDISDLTEAKLELEKTKHRLELILQSVSDGIFGLNEHGDAAFVNAAALEMLGYERGEMLQQSIHQITHHSHPDGTPYDDRDCPINRAISAGESTHVANEVFWDKSGKPIPVDYRSSPIIDQGSVVGAVVTFRDLTDKKKRRQSEQELQTARVVQQQLYPSSAPKIPGFDVYGTVMPASQACGDYFDFISPAEHRHVFAVGDVTGHGLAPALQMVETRAILRSLLDRETDLGVAAELLNHHLFEDLPEGNFVSLFLAELDLRLGRLRYVGAGHDALIVRTDGHQDVLDSTGLLLGLTPDAKYEERTVPLHQPGDLLAILTDGIIESMSPEGKLFGKERMIHSLRTNRRKPCREIASRLLSRALSFNQGGQHDDMTMVFVKVLEDQINESTLIFSKE